MEYSVELISQGWCVCTWKDDRIEYTMICTDRKQADRIAQQLAKAYSQGKRLYAVITYDGDINRVHGVCTRERDTKRIIARLKTTHPSQQITINYTLAA